VPSLARRVSVPPHLGPICEVSPIGECSLDLGGKRIHASNQELLNRMVEHGLRRKRIAKKVRNHAIRQCTEGCSAGWRGMVGDRRWGGLRVCRLLPKAIGIEPRRHEGHEGDL